MWRRSSRPARSPNAAARCTEGRARPLLLALLLACAAAGAPSAPFYANDFARRPSAVELAALGRALFFDPALSASGQLACASCHDPQFAFAAPNGLAVQYGGRDGRRPGVRAVPSLMYLAKLPRFTEHFVDDEGDDGVDQGPAGGRMWDGRAQSAHDQARMPLLSAFEMANASEAQVLSHLEHGAEAGAMRATFGARVFLDSRLAFKGLTLALETYQQEAAEFYPFSSRYDDFLRGQRALSVQELRGLAVFNDPKRGNCARCHPSAMRKGALPLFTDFGYAALGVPRNQGIPANADLEFFDLGLCGPLREDLAGRPEYCGKFKTPSLRNVARRAVFFHNGAIRSLKEAVAFYATRDSEPERWYPIVDGQRRRFDDLPERFLGNLEGESPFDGSRKGPAFSEAEVEDLVAFLQALTDRPGSRR